ncbi:MAG TPA: hypothetical protein VM053_08650 [Gemmatimonadaceae bacterium]|nr:hypothetical protein [Gemmatimonadaceae bacterium]
MTTCAQCLSDLSTMRVSDLREGTSASRHLESCPQCAGIAAEIAYAERRLTTALAETQSSFTPEELSHGALVGSERARRKVVGRWVRGLLAAAGGVTLLVFMENFIFPLSRQSEKIRTETISLRCITPEQAIEIATPYLRSTGAIYTTKGMRIVTVRGRHGEFQQAIARINSIDDAQKCALPNPAYIDPSITMPELTTTSSDKPKKD